MTLGAFIDMGASAEWILHTLRKSLKIDFELVVKTVSRMRIAAKQVEVVSKDSQQRNYSDICRLIEDGNLKDNISKMSLKIFDALAEAESKIHGCSKETVHFHELGGVDAIVDIVGAALCVDHFNLGRVVSSKIPLGRGFVDCAHGTLPVPAPATLEILNNVPVSGMNIEFESVTPTGAAIIKTLAESFENFPDMRIAKIGYGAGSREIKSIPNVLRIITGEISEFSDAVVMVETSIDDMNPEIYGFLMERLFEEGALDVCLIPIFMKKNRPGTLLQVLCHRHLREKIISKILSETTTLGVRYYDVNRRVLERQSLQVQTPFGSLAAKRVFLPDGSSRIVAEYESCRDIAKKENIPIRHIYDLITKLSENSND